MRNARKLGESGFYHVVSKREADQLLFFDDEDRQHYVDLLASARDKFSLRLHSYCVMNNHVHLLLEEDEAYLLCCMRYIHANPAAARICKASAYPWSSVRDYLGRDGITDTGLLMDMCNGRKGFINISRDEPPIATPFLGSRLVRHLTPEEQRWVAEQVVGDKLESLSKQDPATHDEVLGKLLDCGLLASEIAGITDVSRATAYRVAHARETRGTVP